MIFRFLLTFISIFCMSANIFSQDSTEVVSKNGELTLNIVGIENDDGNVRIALSNSKEDYTNRGSAFRGITSKIQNNKAQIIFKELPFGTYAIKIFHDENDNGKLDTNFLGIPSEDYGFSNNAKGSFGPASWEDAQFEFNEEKKTIEIKID